MLPRPKKKYMKLLSQDRMMFSTKLEKNSTKTDLRATGIFPRNIRFTRAILLTI